MRDQRVVLVFHLFKKKKSGVVDMLLIHEG